MAFAYVSSERPADAERMMEFVRAIDPISAGEHYRRLASPQRETSAASAATYLKRSLAILQPLAADPANRRARDALARTLVAAADIARDTSAVTDEREALKKLQPLLEGQLEADPENRIKQQRVEALRRRLRAGGAAEKTSSQ
jgi:hypothetical protein